MGASTLVGVQGYRARRLGVRGRVPSQHAVSDKGRDARPFGTRHHVCPNAQPGSPWAARLCAVPPDYYGQPAAKEAMNALKSSPVTRPSGHRSSPMPVMSAFTSPAANQVMKALKSSPVI